jgi:RNA polymerase sigma-70 factor (ECF subfamily)
MSASTEIPLTVQQLEAYTAFYKEDYKPLLWLLTRGGACAQEAEDVAQEAMIVALQHWPTIEHPKAYVRTVATRTLRRRWDVAKRENRAAQCIAQDVVTAPFEANEDVELALRMLWALPDAQRMVFALHVDGYTIAEIAEIAAQKPDTARSNLRHARTKLLRMLSSDSTRREATHGP